MMRTFFVLMIAAVMSFSLIGCKGKQSTPQSRKPAETQAPAEGTAQQPEGSMTKPENKGMMQQDTTAEKSVEHPVGSGTKTK